MFENLGRGLSRLERPGNWQNRGGFAFSPHLLTANAETPLPPSSAIRENQSEYENAGYGVTVTGIVTSPAPKPFRNKVPVPGFPPSTVIETLFWP